MATEKSQKNHNQDSILETARKRLDLAIELEREQRELEDEDLKFRAGDQWDKDLERERTEDGRPCITINKIPGHVRQVTNEQRQNRPAMRVSPVDDKGDIDTAEVLQGMFRHIEYNSNAEVAYDTGFEYAVVKGRGYWRVITGYVDDDSFDQEILIKKIKNQSSVYLDPSAQEPDGSDANWGFIFEDMTIEDYKAEFGDSKMACMRDWTELTEDQSKWVTDKTVRVAEYFYKEFEKKKLSLLSDGQVITDLKDGMMLPEDAQIVSEREVQVAKIKWAKINACEILDKTDWPGKWIPIIPVYGDELVIDGKVVYEGIVRHAKDPQKMYNYWVSSETETIALAPRNPYIGVEGQFEGYEEDWANAHRKNIPFLQYKSVDVDGKPAGQPSRNAYEPPTAAITNARMQSNEDLKSTTGIHDASLGIRSNEQSGIAIQRRNVQAQTSNYHFIDNHSRSLRHTGRIVIDLIPKIYDVPRIQRIIGEDGEQKVVGINGAITESNKDKIFDLTTGKYDVTVSTGPSYATKRQEAVENLISFVQAYPQAGPLIGDLIAKNMDAPESQEIAERLRKMLPPELQDQDGQAPPPQIQAQMAQMSQMIEQLTGALQAANEERRMKLLEINSKEKMKAAELETDILLETMKESKDFANQELARQRFEMDREQARLDAESQALRQSDSAGLGQTGNQPNQQPDLLGSQQGLTPGDIP